VKHFPVFIPTISLLWIL